MSLLWRQAKRSYRQEDRIRKAGAGRKYYLESMDEKLALVLIYYRTYAIQDLLSYMFGIDQSNVSRLIQKLEPLLEVAAGPALRGSINQSKEARRQGKACGLLEFIEAYPEATGIITDATEVRCLRPKDKENRKKYYSGKKKTHTIKTQLTVARSNQKILNISDSYPGSVHDKKIFDIEKTCENIPKSTPHWMDLGYLGVQHDYPEHYNILPIKKPRGKELSPFARSLNRTHSKIRILIEHVLSRIKKFKIIEQVYRGKVDRFNQTFRNIVAIYNFKLGEMPATS